MDKLHGREPVIFDKRDRKLEAARQRRAEERQRPRVKLTESRAAAMVDAMAETSEESILESMTVVG